MTGFRIAARLNAEDIANMKTIEAALTDPHLRPSVRVTDTVRTALRLAAATLNVTTINTGA